MWKIGEDGRQVRPTRREQVDEVEAMLNRGLLWIATTHAKVIGLTPEESMHMSNKVARLLGEELASVVRFYHGPVIHSADTLTVFPLAAGRLEEFKPLIREEVRNLEGWFPVGAAHIAKAWGIDEQQA